MSTSRKWNKTFALALGGGGARGLAHIAVVEALDEMGVKPVAIAGTSIGALVGAAYAAGMRGKDMRHHILEIAHRPAQTRRRLLAARAGRFTDLLFGDFGQATQIDAEKLCAQFLPQAIPEDFADLKIPLTVVATDLHRREETSLSEGALRPAIAASIAIPGLFRPVLRDGRILIDGGATNPLPFDHLLGRADAVIAVDIFGIPMTERTDVPSAWESLFTALSIMGATIVAAKHRHAAPDLTIRPNVTAFRTLDFHQASAILRAAETVKAEVQEKLGGLLSAAPEKIA
jgi:NTE family protein